MALTFWTFTPGGWSKLSPEGREVSASDELVADTLGMVNVVREAFGAEPLGELPRATTGAPQDCLFYRALADIGVVSVGGNGAMEFVSPRVAEVVATMWGTTPHGRNVQAPSQFGKVIHAFDGRRHPEFIDNNPS